MAGARGYWAERALVWPGHGSDEVDRDCCGVLMTLRAVWKGHPRSDYRPAGAGAGTDGFPGRLRRGGFSDAILSVGFDLLRSWGENRQTRVVQSAGSTTCTPGVGMGRPVSSGP